MIVEQAYLELYPEAKLGEYSFSLSYSNKFNKYNGNVMRRGKEIHFKFSKQWERINDDVKIGLIQLLMNKIFKTKIRTQNIELYEIFLKKVHIAIPKSSVDPILSEIFNRVNREYFSDLIEMPNLVWGHESFRKLGSYEYGSDTITISKIFLGQEELLSYIMYHEMLHKKHKFNTKNGRSFHHTKAFLEQERQFKNQKEIEERIKHFIRQYRRNKRFFGLF